MTQSWGKNLTAVTIADRNFAPGVYGLFNSLSMNEFSGKLLFLTYGEPDSVSISSTVFERKACVQLGAEYSIYADRAATLAKLPDGDYVYLDSDIIIERPCGFLFEPLADSVIVSTEPERKTDLHDVMVWHQCKQAGIKFLLPEFEYINSGLIGFSFPRDRALMEYWSKLSSEVLKGVEGVFSNPYFKFPEQDLLNIVIRNHLAGGNKVASISPRQLELGGFSTLFQDRSFPYTKQGDLQPRDQVKYIIHGAALRRPWLRRKGKNFSDRVKSKLDDMGIGAMKRGTSPYERAWAYYACAKDAPIPLSAWAAAHEFNAYKNKRWRKAYGL